MEYMNVTALPLKTTAEKLIENLYDHFNLINLEYQGCGKI